MKKTDLIFIALLITFTEGGAQATAASPDSAPATATHAGAGAPACQPWRPER